MLNHTTIHVGVTREVVEKMKRTKRVVGMVSRGDVASEVLKLPLE